MTEPLAGPDAAPADPGTGHAEVAAAPADPGTGHAEVAAAPADPGTGHAEVDAALAELSRAGRLPPDQQIAAYESVHRTLQDTLRTIEQS